MRSVLEKEDYEIIEWALTESKRWMSRRCPYSKSRINGLIFKVRRLK